MHPNIRQRPRRTQTEDFLPSSTSPPPLTGGNGPGELRVQIRYAALDKLRPPKRELRKHSDKQVAQIEASLRRFGCINPIVVDEDNEIVVGVGRFLAAKKIGLKEFPTVCVSHLSPAELRAYRIAENRTAELSEWDEETLALEFKELLDLDLEDIEVTGFGTAEIDNLVLKLDDDQAPEEEVEEPQAVVVAKLGDEFILGDHRLHCADALLPESYAALMGQEQARMAFCDPPYNVPVHGHVCGSGKIKHDEFIMASGEMTKPEFTAFLTKVFQNLVAVSVDGAIHFQCMDWRHHQEMGKAGDAAYETLKNIIVWNKETGGMGSFYRSQHELIFVYKVGTAPHLNNFRLGETGRYRTNVWAYKGCNGGGKRRLEDLAAHPTVKPTAMVADAIRDVSRRGDIILDAFCGSGTTILAAERTGRRARCLELEPKYVDAAIRRWEKATGRDAIHSESDLTFAQLTAKRGDHLADEEGF